MSAILLIAVPIIAAFLSILNKKIAPYLLLLVSLFSVFSLHLYEIGTIVIGGFDAPFGISLEFDLYSKTALYIVNIIFFIIVTVTGAKYQKLSTILMVALAGLNGLLLTGDLFNLFVFMEISGIAAYLITTTNKKPLATFNYLVQGTVGSSLYLLGLIILYAMFGTLNMADMTAQITASGATATQVAFPFLLMFIGLGVEAKLLPFNSWVKGILESSNTLSGPMIAAVYAAAMSFVFGRLLTNVFVVNEQLGLIVTVVVMFSIVAGEAMAYQANKLRQILLFSSVAQAGLVILLFANGIVGWAVMMIVANAASKLVLFLITNEMVAQTGTDEVNELKGVFANNKIVGLSFTAVSLSVIGLPVFIGFVIKMNMLQDLIAQDHLYIVATILVASIVEGVYFVKALVKLWYGKEEAKEVSFDFVLKYAVAIIAILMVVYGTFTAPVENHANDLDATTYAEGVNI